MVNVSRADVCFRQSTLSSKRNSFFLISLIVFSAAYEMTSARLDGNEQGDRGGGRSVMSAPNDLLSDQRAAGYDDNASYGGGYSTGQYTNNYSQPPQRPAQQTSQQYAYP